MRTFTQNRDGTGNGADSDLINRFLARLVELQFYDSTTVTFEQMSRGIRAHVKIPPSVQGGGWDWAAAGFTGQASIYDKTQSYSPKDIVYVKTTDTMVTAGTVDPDTGETVNAVAGKWLCLQAVSPVINPPDLPAGTYYRIPQLPYPTPDDPTADNNYWEFISGVPQCY